MTYHYMILHIYHGVEGQYYNLSCHLAYIFLPQSEGQLLFFEIILFIALHVITTTTRQKIIILNMTDMIHIPL